MCVDGDVHRKCQDDAANKELQTKSFEAYVRLTVDWPLLATRHLPLCLIAAYLLPEAIVSMRRRIGI
jgi:hypothetical protein